MTRSTQYPIMHRQSSGRLPKYGHNDWENFQGFKIVNNNDVAYTYNKNQFRSMIPPRKNSSTECFSIPPLRKKRQIQRLRTLSFNMHKSLSAIKLARKRSKSLESTSDSPFDGRSSSDLHLYLDKEGLNDILIDKDSMWQPLEGILSKYTNVMKGWQYRWFVLEPNTGRLEYYEKEELKSQKARGSVHLAGAVISPSDEDSQTFTVNAANGDIYRLRASDARERQHWVNRLRATSEHHTDSIVQNLPHFAKDRLPAVASTGQLTPKLLKRNNSGSLDSLPSAGTNSRRLATQPSAPPSLTKHVLPTNGLHSTASFNGMVKRQQFSGELTETESSSARPSGLKVRKFSFNKLRRSHRYSSGTHQGAALAPPAQVITASVSDDCFKNVTEMLDQAQTQQDRLSANIEILPTSEVINCLDKDLLMLKATSGATLSCLEQCLSILQQQQIAAGQTNSLPYSNNSDWIDPKPLQLSLPPPNSRVHADLISPAESFVSASEMVFDSLSRVETNNTRLNDCMPCGDESEVEDTEEYTDTDLGAVDEHKNIILHLLSQLKLGMDLTKVVLPTFILEKRSLLEMFADCMSHADMFIGIADLSSPEDRMLAVTEWYLTSFHVGRKGSIAKKPYNPIIGETFHCSWKIPHNFKSSQSQITPCCNSKAKTNSSLLLEQTESISSGDQVELTQEDLKKSCSRLTYCAEQVSHHPPVTAFYYECPEKKICMNASIWTKSKFMGMSIGVVMVGKVRLNLVGLNEEYELSLPSAYARSILTIPWVELGDKVNIHCQKTGCSSSVTFHTKPFYGGKLHKVSSEVKRPDGETFCKIAGEWNGSLDFTFSDGRTKVLDTTQMRGLRKCVRPLTKQAEFESRRLWQHVTENLKSGDIDAATQHKRFLEERQRQGERHRKESGTSFPTKYFHKEGDNWVYNNVLKC